MTNGVELQQLPEREAPQLEKTSFLFLIAIFTLLSLLRFQIYTHASNNDSWGDCHGSIMEPSPRQAYFHYEEQSDEAHYTFVIATPERLSIQA